jgi:3-deoxy-D-manno-octulosonic-acid transferase
MEIARPHVSDWLELIANPLDFPIRTGAFVRRIHPKALLMVEADLWPNRVEACRLMAIPTALINARLSVRSERRFSVIRRLVSPIFNSLDLITLTEPGDEPRWVALGVSGERLHLAGNIKYDTRQEETPGIPEWPVGLGWTDDDPVFLAASTHQGEEIEVARAFAKLRSRFPRLRLVIAPRHAERRKEILQELGSLGLKCALRSQTVPPPDADLLILDSTGELKRWYCRATLVFVGKSLPSSVHRGGQNMIEPLQAGRPVLIGPCTSNFEPLATLLCDAGAAKRVHDDGTLEALLENLLGDPAKRAAMVEASGSVLAPHQSATIRNCRLVERLLER